MKTNNYFSVQGWMVNGLGLSGNELMAYAMVYGFSQDGESEFRGTSRYISEWLSVTKVTTIKIMKTLLDKELIIRRDSVIDGNVNPFYTVNQSKITQAINKSIEKDREYKNLRGIKTIPVGVKKLYPTSIETIPNNYNPINENNYLSIAADAVEKEIFSTLKEKSSAGQANAVIESSAKSYNKPLDSRFMFFCDKYNANSKNSILLSVWNKLSEEEKDTIKSHIEKYVDYQPDKSFLAKPINYLRNKEFYNDVVDRRPKPPKKDIISV